MMSFMCFSAFACAACKCGQKKNSQTLHVWPKNYYYTTTRVSKENLTEFSQEIESKTIWLYVDICERERGLLKSVTNFKAYSRSNHVYEYLVTAIAKGDTGCLSHSVWNLFYKRIPDQFKINDNYFFSFIIVFQQNIRLYSSFLNNDIGNSFIFLLVISYPI